MSKKSTRIAIINPDKCKPDKCQKECKTSCPVEKNGKECIVIGTDIEDIQIVNSTPNKNVPKKKYAKIIESACISCSLCVKRCPFDAIKMVNIPNEINGTIIHRYDENGFRLYNIPIMRSHQVMGILGRNGCGKCLHPDTPVLLYDGHIKKAKNIIETDTLMGDDGSPRNIISLVSGEDEMYEINPKRGRSYIVNSRHILTVLPQKPQIIKNDKFQVHYVEKYEIKNKSFDTLNQAKIFSKIINIDPIDISVIDFINSTETYKNMVSGYHVGVNFNHFNHNDNKLSLDSYFLGYWLGDDTPGVNKNIPYIYKTASRQDRLKLLAGFIDSNGYCCEETYFEIKPQNAILADDIEYLCFSLGFGIYRDKQNESEKMHISGEQLYEIPTLLLKNKILFREIGERSTLNNLTVKSIGKGKYNGFQITGNGRFLLGDFTVTHNSTVMSIVANKIKPNFEEFDKVYEDKEIIKMFKGTEMHKFMEKLYKKQYKISIKPQHVETLTKYLRIKGVDPTVGEYLHGVFLENETNAESFDKIINTLELNQILQSKVRTTSGGELQRIVCASTLLKKADLYVFDEPSNFLDIKQRLNMAELIRDLVDPNKYVVVIEHDLALLDYMSDFICIMYGEPGAFGVVSKPHSTAEAINMYFDGYIPSENMRFRTEEYNIKDLKDIESEVKVSINTDTNSLKIDELKKDELKPNILSYDGTFIKYEKFELEIKGGTFPINSSITIVLGENGVGKSTFVSYLAKELSSAVSYKPQYLNIDQFIDKKTETFPTVEQFFYNNIRDKYINELFKSDVVRPMQINLIKDRTLDQLSGGELQRFFIVYCLGQDAHIYLIDEPSACLDVEQRVITTKVIKRFIIHNQKVGFIVEHDMMMAVSMAQEINSQIVVIEKSCDSEGNRKSIACEPIHFTTGINKFLKSLGITFRTESTFAKHARPRINKKGSTKDREQKSNGKYYM